MSDDFAAVLTLESVADVGMLKGMPKEAGARLGIASINVGVYAHEKTVLVGMPRVLFKPFADDEWSVVAPSELINLLIEWHVRYGCILTFADVMTTAHDADCESNGPPYGRCWLTVVSKRILASDWKELVLAQQGARDSVYRIASDGSVVIRKYYGPFGGDVPDGEAENRTESPWTPVA